MREFGKGEITGVAMGGAMGGAAGGVTGKGWERKDVGSGEEGVCGWGEDRGQVRRVCVYCGGEA